MGAKKKEADAGTAAEMVLSGLAARVADDAVLRQHVLTHKTLFQWPSAKRVGIITLESAALNSRLLRMLVEIWVPKSPKKPKTIPCEAARFEAGWLKRMFSCIFPHA